MGPRQADRREQISLTLVVALAVFAVAGTAINGLPPGSIARAVAATPTPAAAVTPVPVPVVTTAAPTVAPTPTAAPRGRLVIHGVGDTNLDPRYIPALAAEGYAHAFDGLEGLFRDDSLSVVNLECAVSELGAAVPKAFNFRCDPDALPAARAAGVDVANLANNHSGDYGVDAMVDSRRVVAAAGIAPVGVGADLSEAVEPAIVEVDGWTIAVLGMGGVVPASSWLAGPTAPGMASGDDVDQMTEAVRAADAIADLVVVSIHWGAELETRPPAGDVARAEAMVAAGADVIFGHHAHRLQPLEVVDGAAVAWGLGNFVWPRLSQAGATTAVARVVVEPDGTMAACLLPAEIVTDGHPRLTEPPGAGCPPATSD